MGYKAGPAGVQAWIRAGTEASAVATPVPWPHIPLMAKKARQSRKGAAGARDRGAAAGAGRKSPPVEKGGPKGPEPTRFGDWEKNGRCTDF